MKLGEWYVGRGRMDYLLLITIWLLPLLGSFAAAPEKPVNSTDRGDAAAREIRRIVDSAFDQGGAEFLAAARTYQEAVDELDKLLATNWGKKRQEVKEACYKVAAALEGTRLATQKIDKTGFSEAFAQALEMARRTTHLHEGEITNYNRILKKYEGKSDLKGPEDAERQYADSGKVMAEIRRRQFERIQGSLEEIRNAVIGRNDMLTEMNEVNHYLAETYKNLAITIDAVDQASEIIRVLDQISLESKSLSPKIRKTLEQITKALNDLEKAVAPNKEVLP